MQGSPNTFTVDSEYITVYKPDNAGKTKHGIGGATVLKLTSSADKSLHQVEILLSAESNETLIFESQSLHECKVLGASISYFKNRELAAGIEMAWHIEKATRLARILNAMVYSMAKRNV